MDWTGHVHGKHGLSTHFVIVKRGLKTCKHFITSNIFEFAVPSEANCYGGGLQNIGMGGEATKYRTNRKKIPSWYFQDQVSCRRG